MDITAWLSGVESKHPRRELASAYIANEGTHQVQNSGADSILEALPYQKHDRYKAFQKSPIARFTQHPPIYTGSGKRRAYRGRDASCSRSDGLHSSSDHLYSRKKRHKTKIDRYLPKQHRTEGPCPFRSIRPAKNVEAQRKRRANKVPEVPPRDNMTRSRLTIEPGILSGLFKHGKASRSTKLKRVNISSQEASFLDASLNTILHGDGHRQFKIDESDRRGRALAQEHQLNDYFIDQRHIQAKHGEHVSHPPNQDGSSHAEAHRPCTSFSQDPNALQISLSNQNSTTPLRPQNLSRWCSEQQCVSAVANNIGNSRIIRSDRSSHICHLTKVPSSNDQTFTMPTLAGPHELETLQEQHSANRSGYVSRVKQEDKQPNSENDDESWTNYRHIQSGNAARARREVSRLSKDPTRPEVSLQAQKMESSLTSSKYDFPSVRSAREALIDEGHESLPRSMSYSAASPLKRELDGCKGISQALEQDPTIDWTIRPVADDQRQYADHAQVTSRGSVHPDYGFYLHKTSPKSCYSRDIADEDDLKDIYEEQDGSTIDTFYRLEMDGLHQPAYDDHGRATYEPTDGGTRSSKREYDSHEDMDMTLKSYQTPLMAGFWQPNKLF